MECSLSRKYIYLGAPAEKEECNLSIGSQDSGWASDYLMCELEHHIHYLILGFFASKRLGASEVDQWVKKNRLQPMLDSEFELQKLYWNMEVVF